MLEIHRPLIRASSPSGLMERLLGRKVAGTKTAVQLYSNEALTLQLVLHSLRRDLWHDGRREPERNAEDTQDL